MTSTKAPLANPLLSGRILPTLARLTIPNLVAMAASALVAIAETAYVGRLGTPALAGLALCFPLVMLMQMMSAGAMGGGISSAVSRALGAGDVRRASALALHAVVIGTAAGLVFTMLFTLFGRQILMLLGGRDVSLEQGLAYAGVVFMGSVGIWLTNTLASILRGAGNMRLPSLVLLSVSVVQIVLGAILGLGYGPIPAFGMQGIAAALVVSFTGGALALLFVLIAGRAAVRLIFDRTLLRAEMFRDILKVGALACASPVMSVLTVLILTALVARLGPLALAGYGIGARLEFLLVPITFAIGVAAVPMVGMAIGAGDVARARRVAWTAGAVSAAMLGAIGLLVAVFPDAWGRIYTDDREVLAAAASYFDWAGPAYAFYGLGLCIYFASQGSGRMLPPVLAQALRLAIVASGGWLALRTGAAPDVLFAVVGVAMVGYGIATALGLYFSRWGAR